MRVIHKYQLLVLDEQTLSLPRGAKPLDVQDQHGVICLWAIVETTEPLVDRIVRIFLTGEPITDGVAISSYVCTVQTTDGLVWHVFIEDEL